MADINFELEVWTHTLRSYNIVKHKKLDQKYDLATVIHCNTATPLCSMTWSASYSPLAL